LHKKDVILLDYNSFIMSSFEKTDNDHFCRRLYFVFLTVLFVLIAKTTSAQFLGTASNYAGSHVLAINPSLMTTSYCYADFGLNLRLLAYNDMFFLPSGEILSTLKSSKYSYKFEYDGNLYDIGFLINKNPKKVNETLDFAVLSGMRNIDGKQSVGAFLNMRLYTDAYRIPWEIPEMMIVSFDNGDYFNKDYKSKNWDISTMTWSEIGLSYSRVIYERYNDKIDVGATVKGLLGYDAAVLHVNNIDYEILNKDSAFVKSIDADIVYSLPLDYDKKFADGNILNLEGINGHGMGFDFGVTYTRKKNTDIPRKVKRACSYPITPYQWRFGLSFLNIGAIRFNNGARSHNISGDVNTVVDFSVFNDIQTINNLFDTLDMIFADGDVSSSNGAIRVGLPTVFSMQFDYNISHGLFVNASWLHPLKLMKYSVRRAALLMVEPRYERQLFEISLPVTFYNYEKVFVGLSARVGFITIGTHNLLNIIGIRNAYGLDFYLALKFNLHKGSCASGKGACWNSDFR